MKGQVFKMQDLERDLKVHLGYEFTLIMYQMWITYHEVVSKSISQIMAAGCLQQMSEGQLPRESNRNGKVLGKGCYIHTCTSHYKLESPLAFLGLDHDIF